MDIDEIAATSLANSRRWFPHVPMTLSEPHARLLHCTLGVCGEIGETWERFEIDGFRSEVFFEELTDVLIYLLILAELTETVLDDDALPPYPGLPSSKLTDLTVRVGKLANEIKKINRSGWDQDEYDKRIGDVQTYINESVGLCISIFEIHHVRWDGMWAAKTYINDSRWGAVATVKYGEEVVGDGETRS